ncbi:MAG: hypothetical protein LBD99_01325 [Candidatus Margulisbacteria bacterium]|nr:hypothetical protein [Candidatus Margulisiibacteriota bacterium]
MRLVPIFKRTVRLRADDPAGLSGLYSVFPPNSRIMIVQTHSDDCLIHAGCTAAIIGGALKNMSWEAHLATLVSDEAGVTDSYARNYYKNVLRPQGSHYAGLQNIKRYIRYRESNLNAAELGFQNRHTQFDFSWPVISAVYDHDGKRLLSSATAYRKPTNGDLARVCDFVADFRADIYLMAWPGSLHQHHRQSTSLFLKAIKCFNPSAYVYFWRNKEEKENSLFPDNICLYYSDQQEKENSLRIHNANDSQNTRRGGSGHYYEEMAEDIGQYVNKRYPLADAPGHYAEGFWAARIGP